jgi:hypothetical protein
MSENTTAATSHPVKYTSVFSGEYPWTSTLFKSVAAAAMRTAEMMRMMRRTIVGMTTVPILRDLILADGLITTQTITLMKVMRMKINEHQRWLENLKA